MVTTREDIREDIRDLAWDPKFVRFSISSRWQTSVKPREVLSSSELVLSQSFPMPLKFYACWDRTRDWPECHESRDLREIPRDTFPPCHVTPSLRVTVYRECSVSWPAHAGTRYLIKCYRTEDMCLFLCEPLISRCDLVINNYCDY